VSDAPALLSDTIEFSAVDGPGNRFVVFLQGCNFDCQACHNPQTIADTNPQARQTSVSTLIEEIRPRAPFLSGVTVSGGEPTRQPSFVADLFATIRADAELCHLTTFVDSNGSAPPSVWDDLMPVLDGAMIDLKAFDPEVHEQITGQPNMAVLTSIRHLAAHDRLYEVRLLLVPGVNDDPGVLADTAAWLGAVCPGTRLKLIGFRPHGVRAPLHETPAATSEQMESYRDLLAGAGHEIVAV
jgi:pyruvate formate lyase activating enzyme